MARRPHRVVVLALPPVVGYDLVIPPQVLGHPHGSGGPLYEVVIASVDGSPVYTDFGYGIVPQADASSLGSAETVIIPGTLLPGARLHGRLPDEVAEALALIRPGTRIVSICTGAFVLAAAGLLNGRPATTHWHKANDFRALYPDVDLREDVLFIDDGDVLTSAGLGAGVDICLHLLRLDHGAAVANDVARYCVVPPFREGGQAQYIARPVVNMSAGSTSASRVWAIERLEQDLDVRALAEAAAMSVRHFTRRFREETGNSPGAWLLEQRLQRARELLETTDLGIDEVARRAGFGTSASLRAQLSRRVGVSPSVYRRTFRGADHS